MKEKISFLNALIVCLISHVAISAEFDSTPKDIVSNNPNNTDQVNHEYYEYDNHTINTVFTKKLTISNNVDKAIQPLTHASKATISNAARQSTMRFSTMAYDKDIFLELKRFMSTTSNPNYGELKFYELIYDVEKPLQERWCFKEFKRRAYFEEQRIVPLLELLNKNKKCHFHRTFSIGILLQEPGYLLNENDISDQGANDELERILEKCPVLGPCANDKLSWTKNLILIPDFYTLFDARTDVEAVLDAKLLSLHDRINQMFFSGALSGFPHPFTRDKVSTLPRFKLLEYADSHPFIVYNMTNGTHLKNKKITDSGLLDWFNAHHSHKKGPNHSYITHANYKYLLAFDGFGAAWGRVPSILATGSVLLLQTECEQWFSPWLKPYEHYVPIKKDLSDLEDVYTWLETNPVEAERLGQNGRNLAARFLTRQANEYYLSEVFSSLYVSNNIMHLGNMYYSKLIHTYAEQFFGTNKKQIDNFISSVNAQYRLKMDDISKKDNLSNVKETHRIWLTATTAAEEVSEELLAFYGNSLTLYTNYQHHFWCFDRAKIPETVKRIESMGVTIHETGEMQHTFITKRLFDKLVSDKLYGFASNLARFEILYQRGGIYADIGLEQNVNMEPLLDTFDTLFYVKNNGELDICAMACPEKSALLKRHLEFIRDLPLLDESKKAIDMNGAPMQAITTSYTLLAGLPSFAENHPECAIGFMQQDKEFTYHGMRKWKAPWVVEFLKNHPNYFFE
jgi:hypothetical protein